MKKTLTIEELEILDKKPETKFLFNVHESGHTKINIINSHLIIEEILDSFLIKHFKILGRYHKANLKFHQKLHLAAALLGDDFNENLYASLIKLNSVRNDYSHSLESEKVQIHIQDFLNLVPSVAFEKQPSRLDSIEAMFGSTRSPDKLYLSLKWVVTEMIKIGN